MPRLHLRYFFRQYIGILVGGKRVIYVNAFSPEYSGGGSDGWFAHWREHLVVVCDGAWAYWGVQFDLESKRFFAFSFHYAV